MATGLRNWPWARIVIGALAAVAVIEGVLLYQQREAVQAGRAASDRLLTTFLQRDTTRAEPTRGVLVGMKNVRFIWSKAVFIDADNLAVRAVPLQGNSVDFDDPKSFLLELRRSSVLLRPSVLEGMLNESIFNYPGSKLRDLRVALVDEDGRYALRLSGRINVVVWVPFAMITRLGVDRATNTLVMQVDRLKLFGALPATKLLKLSPFHLDKLIPEPPNKSLLIQGNRILVKPFGLFPPPRINGTVADVGVDENGIRLQFAGAPIPAPKVDARNYVYLRGGTSQFGHFRMLDTNVLVLDRNQGSPFTFSLLHYEELIPRSQVEVHDTRSVRVVMPDFSG